MLYSLMYVCYISMFISDEAILVLIIYQLLLYISSRYILILIIY